MERWVDIIVTPDLLDLLRAEFSFFQTFIIVSPQWAYIPPGYPQGVYDYVDANFTAVDVDPIPGNGGTVNFSGALNKSLALGSITAGDYQGQRGFVPELGEWFQWVEDAGVAGEWWADVKSVSWGNVGNTGNGTPFRLVGYMATNGSRGFPIPGRIRCIQMSGQCLNPETGTIQVRRNQVTQFDVGLASQSSINRMLAIDSANYLIETVSGDAIAPLSDQNILQFYWLNSTSGSIRDAQFRMRIADVLIPGD